MKIHPLFCKINAHWFAVVPLCVVSGHMMAADTQPPSPMNPASPTPQVILDKQIRSDVVEAAAKALEDKYVFVDLGRQMAQKIRDNNKSDVYATVTTGEELARSAAH